MTLLSSSLVNGQSEKPIAVLMTAKLPLSARPKCRVCIRMQFYQVVETWHCRASIAPIALKALNINQFIQPTRM